MAKLFDGDFFFQSVTVQVSLFFLSEGRIDEDDGKEQFRLARKKSKRIVVEGLGPCNYLVMGP